MRDMPDDMSDPPTNADLDRWFGPEPDAPGDDREFIEPPAWEDELDTSHRQLVDAARQAGTEHHIAGHEHDELEAGG